MNKDYIFNVSFYLAIVIVLQFSYSIYCGQSCWSDFQSYMSNKQQLLTNSANINRFVSLLEIKAVHVESNDGSYFDEDDDDGGGGDSNDDYDDDYSNYDGNDEKGNGIRDGQYQRKISRFSNSGTCID